MLQIVVLLICVNFIGTVYHYDYEEVPQKTLNLKYNEPEETDPIVSTIKEREKITLVRNVPCEDFQAYSIRCTQDAALIYNSSKPTPPMPAKLGDWCRAIKHLTNCAIDWNADCKDVTDYHFNEDSIKGHLHVLENVCDNDWFMARYSEIFFCIRSTAILWEYCYLNFKLYADGQKNSTKDWTHYETHFYLCCARAHFRRCTLDALFMSSNNCSHEHASLLQKYSTVVSEGEVFQDCEFNMMYPNCPGGDPRPSRSMLAKLMGVDLQKSEATILLTTPCVIPYLIFLLQIIVWSYQ